MTNQEEDEVLLRFTNWLISAGGTKLPIRPQKAKGTLMSVVRRNGTEKMDFNLQHARRF